MIHFFKIGLTAVSALVLTLACDPQSGNSTSDCTPAGDNVVELTSALAGKTFSVGETVRITWKIDRNPITNGQIVVDVSNDNGIGWSAIPAAGMVIPQGDQYQCMSLDWTIGEEGEIVEYASNNSQCMLRIHEYSNVSNGVVFSDQKFSIRKN